MRTAGQTLYSLNVENTSGFKKGTEKLRNIDVQNEKIKNILTKFHERIINKLNSSNYSGSNSRFIIVNKLISIISMDRNGTLRSFADDMRNIYSINVPIDGIQTLLRNNRLHISSIRNVIMTEASKMAYYIADAISGDKKAFELLSDMHKAIMRKPKDENIQSEKYCDLYYRDACKIFRVAIVTLFTKFKEIDILSDKNNIMQFGDVLGKYGATEIINIISEEYGYSRRNKKQPLKPRTVSIEEFERVTEKAESLSGELERTNSLLQDLQDEFEQRIEEQHLQELTDLFSRLNSDSYGYILDALFILRKGISDLRKSNYAPPQEINGLMIMASNMLKFIRDSHIDPVMKVNSVIDVTAKDIEDCNYIGSPFENADDIKTVRVISPGWIYRDKKIIISRPEVKEEQ